MSPGLLFIIKIIIVSNNMRQVKHNPKIMICQYWYCYNSISMHDRQMPVKSSRCGYHGFVLTDSPDQYTSPSSIHIWGNLHQQCKNICVSLAVSFSHFYKKYHVLGTLGNWGAQMASHTLSPWKSKQETIYCFKRIFFNFTPYWYSTLTG